MHTRRHKVQAKMRKAVTAAIAVHHLTNPAAKKDAPPPESEPEPSSPLQNLVAQVAALQDAIRVAQGSEGVAKVSKGHARAEQIKELITERIVEVTRGSALGDAEVDVFSAFKRFDRDKSGNLNYAEFGDGLKQLGVDLDPGDFDALVGDLDNDGSGTIDFNEFVEDLRAPNRTAPGCSVLSITDIELQDVLFGYFDTDGTGDLGVGEMGRMFSAVNLFDTREELVSLIKQMDDDNSGTISKDEYIQFIDKKCASDPDFHASFTSHCRSAKLGYDGTTWRNHANIDWLSSQGVLILMWLSILAAIIYFRFILVPMTMAYFMTFVLGPIQDVLIQRPLLFRSIVCCDQVEGKQGCIRAQMGESTSCLFRKYSWDPEINSTPLQRAEATPKQDGQWDPRVKKLRWEEAAPSFCYPTPPAMFSDEPMVGGSPVKAALWQLFVVAKIPEALSVLMTLVLVLSFLAATSVVVGNEIQDVAEDPVFQGRYRDFVYSLNRNLKEEYKLEIAELIAANDTGLTETTVLDADTILVVASPWLLLINDLILTLLLCVYMMYTRVCPGAPVTSPPTHAGSGSPISACMQRSGGRSAEERARDEPHREDRGEGQVLRGAEARAVGADGRAGGDDAHRLGRAARRAVRHPHRAAQLHPECGEPDRVGDAAADHLPGREAGGRLPGPGEFAQDAGRADPVSGSAVRRQHHGACGVWQVAQRHRDLGAGGAGAVGLVVGASRCASSLAPCA